MLNTIEIEKILAELPGNSPTGENIKYDDDFIELEEEINKLTSIEQGYSIDYIKIEELSKKILSIKSKDINVICYLSFSLFSQTSVNITSSINILSQFIEKYWSNAFPPLKRIRARVNILSWWFTKIEKHINSIESLYLDDNEKKELTSAIEQFDNILYLTLKEDYSFNLMSLKNFIEIKGIKKDISSDLIKKSPSDTDIVEVSKVEIEPVKNISHESLSNANLKEIEDMYKESLQNTKHLLEHLFQNQIYYKDIFIINRMRIWFEIEQLPINENGLTMLQEPQSHKIDYLKKLFDENKFKELLIEAESLIDEYIFWIDLHFYVGTALAQLNRLEEKMYVEFFVKSFLEKIGDISDFKFKDNKTYFANDKTQKWIEQLNKEENSNDKSKITTLSLNSLFNEFVLIEKNDIKDLL